MASVDSIAPAFILAVEGEELGYGVTQFIERVEFESADGLVDVIKVNVRNPEFLLSNKKVFQPGNELLLAMGYTSKLTFMGRALIRAMEVNYPEDGMPSLSVTAYTADALMADSEPDKGKDRIYEDVKYSDVVQKIAERHGFNTDDIDDTVVTVPVVTQKSGINDLQFVGGLSNLSGFLFWVDGNSDDKQWTLHFKNPAKTVVQDRKYTFVYNRGDDSTLLSFKPQLLLQGFSTKIRAVAKDSKSGKSRMVEMEEENNKAPDLKATGDLIGELTSGHTTASDVKLYLGEFAFEVKAHQRFATEAELQEWTRQWFRRQRENFVIGNGKIIGIESLRARQVHALDGLGGPLNGDYYFGKVRHVMDNSGGYICNFSARKVVPEI